MDGWLKRNFWVVVIALGTISTYFLASGAMQVVGGKYMPLDPLAAKPHATGGGTAASTIPSRVLAAHEILASNPFDSVTGPIVDDQIGEAIPAFPTPPGTIPVVDANGAPKHEFLAPQCQGPTKLEITVVDVDDRQRSFAVFSTGEGPGQKPMVREGQDVAGKQVFVIVREKVYFKDGATYCFIGMFIPPPPPAPAPSVHPGPIPGGEPGGVQKIPPEIEKGIQKVDDTNFNVDRIVVDKIIENQAELMKTARILPEPGPNGKTIGIRLLNIRPDTLLGKLGMQAGDVLKTINGFDMTSPEKALEAYAKLRTAPEIQIGINRGDKPLNIVYTVK